MADGPTFEVLRDGRVLKEAHILPPQVTEVFLILDRRGGLPAAVTEANTVAQMVIGGGPGQADGICGCGRGGGAGRRYRRRLPPRRHGA